VDFSGGVNVIQLYQRVGPDGMSGLVGGSLPRTVGDTMTLVPGWEQYYVRRSQNTTHPIGNATMTWHPGNRFKAHATYGWDFSLRDDEEYTPRNSCLPFCGDTTATSYVGSLWTGRVTTIAQTGDAGASLSLPIGPHWTLLSSAGTQYVRSKYRDVNVRVRNLGFRKGLNGATGDKLVQESGSDYATFGAYLDEQLSFNDRLFLGAAVRRDYASALGPQAPLPLFPKWSISWVVSQEPFFPWKNVSLRLRAAYGNAGTQPSAIARFQLYNTTSSFANINGADTSYGLPYGYIASIGNVAIRPERTVEREGGFELGILHDRLTIDFTAYRKFTMDALVDVPLPSSLGLGSSGNPGRQTRNVGNVLNTGQEVTLNVRVLDNSTATWSMVLGYGSRHNKLVTLGEDMAPYSSAAGYSQTPGDNADARIAPGYPLFGRWARPVLAFHDTNGDGVITASEVRVGDSLVYIGPSEAKYDLGIHQDIGLFRNQLHVAADFQYVNGLVQLNDFAYQNAQSLAYSQIRGAGTLQDQAYLAAATLPLGQQSVYGFFERVNYLRFTTLSVGYTLPTSVTRFLRTRRANVAVLGSNLGLWSSFRGKDPATNVADVAGNRYFNGSAFPAPRSVTFRLTLGY
jgi:hypothetical protein